MSQYGDHPFDLESSNNSWSHLYAYIKDGDRVLDVGCSTGSFGAALKDLKNCEVVGIDIDDADIREAKKKLDKALVMDINSKEALSLGKFNVIIFADVLEHLVDPRETLVNIKGLLKNDGRVLFSLPHMAHMSVRLELMSGAFPYKETGLLDRTHLHFYDKQELEGIFEDAGYNIKNMNPVISEYPPRLIAKKLKKMGLKYTDEFGKYLSSTHGNLFQFVGFAELSNTKKRATHKNLKYVMPQDEVKKYADSILAENKRLWEEGERLKKEMIVLQREIELSRSKRERFKKPLKTMKEVAHKRSRRVGGKNGR